MGKDEKKKKEKKDKKLKKEGRTDAQDLDDLMDDMFAEAKLEEPVDDIAAEVNADEPEDASTLVAPEKPSAVENPPEAAVAINSASDLATTKPSAADAKGNENVPLISKPPGAEVKAEVATSVASNVVNTDVVSESTAEAKATAAEGNPSVQEPADDDASFWKTLEGAVEDDQPLQVKESPTKKKRTSVGGSITIDLSDNHLEDVTRKVLTIAALTGANLRVSDKVLHITGRAETRSLAEWYVHCLMGEATHIAEELNVSVVPVSAVWANKWWGREAQLEQELNVFIFKHQVGDFQESAHVPSQIVEAQFGDSDTWHMAALVGTIGPAKFRVRRCFDHLEEVLTAPRQVRPATQICIHGPILSRLHVEVRLLVELETECKGFISSRLALRACSTGLAVSSTALLIKPATMFRMQQQKRFIQNLLQATGCLAAEFFLSPRSLQGDTNAALGSEAPQDGSNSPEWEGPCVLLAGSREQRWLAGHILKMFAAGLDRQPLTELPQSLVGEYSIFSVPKSLTLQVLGQGMANLLALMSSSKSFVFLLREQSKDEVDDIFRAMPEDLQRGRFSDFAIFGRPRARLHAEIKLMAAVERGCKCLHQRSNSEPGLAVECVQLPGDLEVQAESRANAQILAGASECLVESVGQLVLLAGMLEERQRAREYLTWSTSRRFHQYVMLSDIDSRSDVTCLYVPRDIVESAWLHDQLDKLATHTKTVAFIDDENSKAAEKPRIILAGVALSRDRRMINEAMQDLKNLVQKAGFFMETGLKLERGMSQADMTAKRKEKEEAEKEAKEKAEAEKEAEMRAQSKGKGGKKDDKGKSKGKGTDWEFNERIERESKGQTKGDSHRDSSGVARKDGNVVEEASRNEGKDKSQDELQSSEKGGKYSKGKGKKGKGKGKKGKFEGKDGPGPGASLRATSGEADALSTESHGNEEAAPKIRKIDAKEPRTPAQMISPAAPKTPASMLAPALPRTPAAAPYTPAAPKTPAALGAGAQIAMPQTPAAPKTPAALGVGGVPRTPAAAPQTPAAPKTPAMLGATVAMPSTPALPAAPRTAAPPESKKRSSASHSDDEDDNAAAGKAADLGGLPTTPASMMPQTPAAAQREVKKAKGAPPPKAARVVDAPAQPAPRPSFKGAPPPKSAMVKSSSSSATPGLRGAPPPKRAMVASVEEEPRKKAPKLVTGQDITPPSTPAVQGGPKPPETPTVVPAYLRKQDDKQDRSGDSSKKTSADATAAARALIPQTPVKPNTPQTPAVLKKATPETPAVLKKATPQTPAVMKKASPQTPADIKKVSPQTPADIKKASPQTPAVMKKASPQTPASIAKAATPQTPASLRAVVPQTPASMKSATTKTSASTQELVPEASGSAAADEGTGEQSASSSGAADGVATVQGKGEQSTNRKPVRASSKSASKTAPAKASQGASEMSYEEYARLRKQMQDE